MRLPVEILVLACIVVGILPAATIGPFLEVAVRAVLGAATPEYSLAVWHGFSPPLVLSLIALTGGVILYLALHWHLLKGVEGAPLLRPFQGRRFFDRTMVFLSWRLARTLERWLGTARLQPQLRLVLVVAVAAAAWTIWTYGYTPGDRSPSAPDLVFAGIWVLGAGSALAVAWQAKFHRLAALAMLGITGLVTSLTFVWLSAPDLALTQLMVEVVTTILLLLGLRWLPKRFPVPGEPGVEAPTRIRRFIDLAIAGTVGIGMAALAFGVMTRSPPDPIAEQFLERAYAEGGGTNVVNVILVDFRSFDTLGEITVLGVVALAVFALLRRFRPAPDSVDIPEQQREQNAFEAAQLHPGERNIVADWLLAPSILARLLFPVIVLVALFLLLRGHDLPGGGFVAGLTASVALILQYMVGGTRWVEERLRVLPLRWIGAGLLLAAGTGIGAWVFGRPFLTSFYEYAEIPLIGAVPASSALLFDIGVFVLVVGATALNLTALAHQSVRGHRSARPAAAIAETPPEPAVAIGAE
jgi:multicomponent K+:H+ antiporter subunit A